MFRVSLIEQGNSILNGLPEFEDRRSSHRVILDSRGREAGRSLNRFGSRNDMCQEPIGFLGWARISCKRGGGGWSAELFAEAAGFGVISKNSSSAMTSMALSEG